VKAEGELEEDRPKEDEDRSHTFALSRDRVARVETGQRDANARWTF
jgi:hypothetical protein